MIGADDAFAICAAHRRRRPVPPLTAAAERANEALIGGIPEETRDPLPDGTSKYSRPLPGAARMYPETDVPPIGDNGCAAESRSGPASRSCLRRRRPGSSRSTE
ncbi:MAG: hypothetical protein ACOX10_04470 [Candidatus Methanomethylophilaceae archaeon]